MGQVMKMKVFILLAASVLGAFSPRFGLIVCSAAAEQHAGGDESEAGPIFVDVTGEAGLDGLSNAAAAWGDYNNDGMADLYVDGQLWHNKGDGTFERVHRETFEDAGSGVWGDFNNNGWPDLYCFQSHRLFENIEGEYFTEVSDILPEREIKVSRAAVWLDINGNGFLDLYVTGYEIWDTAQQWHDEVYYNESGRRFRKAWQAPGLHSYAHGKDGNPRRARGVTAADFNETGRPCLFVSNYRLQPNSLLCADEKGIYRSREIEYGVAGNNNSGNFGHTIGSAWGDFDNDGYLDLFVGNFSHPPAWQDRPQFLRNKGPEYGYRFEDLSSGAGLRWQESYASPALADFKNNGRLDFILTAVYSGDRSVLYRNEGNWNFSEVPDCGGIIDSKNTYQAAWADYNNNGYMDIVSGGRLFRNTGGGNNWLKVRLSGAGTGGRMPFGATVRVRTGDLLVTRHLEPATGEGNQNEQTLHFGLGQNEGRAEIEVIWPGKRRSMTSSRVNRIVEIQKGE